MLSQCKCGRLRSGGGQFCEDYYYSDLHKVEECSMCKKLAESTWCRRCKTSINPVYLRKGRDK